MNEKGSIIAEIGDSARDGISYAQFGSESAVSFLDVFLLKLGTRWEACANMGRKFKYIL